MAKLTEKHIRNGTIIWYKGSMALSSWSCPALIMKVDRQARTFKVMSLDDMEEQDTVYEFDITELSSFSRKSMSLVTVGRIGKYLAKRERELEKEVAAAQRELDASKELLRLFRAKKMALPLPY